LIACEKLVAYGGTQKHPVFAVPYCGLPQAIERQRTETLH